MCRLEYFLVALHTKGFQQNKNWDELWKTAWPYINPVILDQHFAHCFGIDCIRDDSCYHCIKFGISLNKDSVFDHLLLNKEYFFSSINNEITSWIIRAFHKICELFLCFSDQMALRASQHNGHSTNLDIFPFLSNPIQAIFNVDTKDRK